MSYHKLSEYCTYLKVANAKTVPVPETTIGFMHEGYANAQETPSC